MAVPKPFPFLLLPLELRQEIYYLLIEDSLLATPRPPKPWAGNYTLWPITPITPFNLGLEITSAKEFLKAIRLESALIYASRQIHSEFSTLLYARVRHLRLTGDFLMGVSGLGTDKILASMAARPWLATSLRTIRIHLRACADEYATREFWKANDVWKKYPALMKHLGDAEEAIKSSEGSAVHFWSSVPKMPWDMALFEREVFVPTGSLAELARVVEGYPLLERVDIDPDVWNVLVLWPDPLEKLRCFEKCHERGVEVNLMLRGWEQWVFFAIMELAGMDVRQAVVLDYEDKGLRNGHVFPATHGGRGTMRYRVFDWRPEGGEEGEKVSTSPS